VLCVLLGSSCYSLIAITEPVAAWRHIDDVNTTLSVTRRPSNVTYSRRPANPRSKPRVQFHLISFFTAAAAAAATAVDVRRRRLSVSIS